jgi:hypothetical protein
LKKRTKKLLLIAPRPPALKLVVDGPGGENKSFLVLFFKKELLSSSLRFCTNLQRTPFAPV